jgi:MinD-like ATPase involved in chromosome partitioning or flagellar assembly
MYVTTFYSFKGGVGRTLALANVAVDLAQTGRKVLIVDFDLEAPGIDTFESFKPDNPQAGVVDYVKDYIVNRASPDVKDYVHECAGIGKDGGKLWCMPAGKSSPGYKAKLASINWEVLYRELDGYLMFEDLKVQWKEIFSPDYVLIDSRTGYTDVGGICTRQLPDAVVLLFFPNEQNLNGLERVVTEIREEAKEPRKKLIKLHFVMSNVPDLDDEEEILSKRMRQFRRALGFRDTPANRWLTCTIHRYDSLALLNQVIFARDRPRSRLSKEYGLLKKAIVKENPEDREGALRFLEERVSSLSFPGQWRVTTSVTPGQWRVTPSGPRQGTWKRDDLDNRLKAIQERHPADGELLFLLAMLRKDEGRLEDALVLLNKSIETGNNKAGVLLQRATIRQHYHDPLAANDASEALRSPKLTPSEVRRAVSILREQEDWTALARVAESPALRALQVEDRLFVVRELSWDVPGQRAAVVILSNILRDCQVSSQLQAHVRNQLSLCLIGLSRFAEAMKNISPIRPNPSDLNIQDAFNYAIAEWGETGVIPRDLFQRVGDLASRDTQELVEPNHAQCFAIAFWAIGGLEEAVQRIDQAQELIEQRRQPEFSCWRYQLVSLKTFLEDCRAIEELISGRKLLPLFFKE